MSTAVETSADNNAPSPTAPATFWAHFQEAASLANYRPEPAEGVAVSQQQDHYILKSPRANCYLRLSPEEYTLWTWMDGQKTVRDMTVAYFLQFQRFMPVADLVLRLRQGQMLIDPPANIRGQLQVAVQAQEEPWGRQVLNLLWGHPVRLRGTDRFFRALHRLGGKTLFSRPIIWLQRLVALAGLVAFVLLLVQGRQGYQVLQAGRSYFWGLLLLVLMNLVTLSLHESAHALATIHHGCEVRRGGFMFYVGLPTLFVDTTDTWMAGKEARVQVAAAGPWSDLVIGGLCALLALPGWASGPILLKIATLAYISAFLNLNPLLELDGYFILSDKLDLPYLRRDAMSFVRQELWQRLRQRQSFSSRERLYAVYGLLALGYLLLVSGLALLFWRTQVSQMLADLLQRGVWGQVATGLLVALVGIPLAVLLGRRLLRAGQQSWRTLAERGHLNQGTVRLALVAGGTMALLLIYHLLPLSWRETALPFLPLLLHGIAMVCLAAVLPFYGGTPFRRVLVFLGVVILLLANGSMLEWAWGQVWLGSDAVRLAQLGALLVALAAFSAEDLVRTHLVEKVLMGLLLGGGFFLSVVLVRQGQTGDLLLAALWASGPAFLGGLALALLVPTVASFIDTPFAPAWDLLSLALALSLARMVPGWPLPLAFALDLGMAFLVAQGAGLYLLAQRYLRYQRDPWVEVPVGIGAHTRLRHGFIRFFNNLFVLFRDTFGRRKAQVLDDRLDIISVTANWLVTVDGGRVREDPRVETFPLDQLSRQYMDLLGHTVEIMDNMAGRPFLRRAIQSAYDSLPWAEREVLAHWVLSRTPWGEAVSQAFFSRKDQDLRLLAQIPMFLPCDEAMLVRLRAALEEVSAPAGHTIVRQGQPVKALWVVASGEVELWQRDETGHERLLEELHRGDTFGEDTLVENRVHPGTYRASVDTLLLRVEEDVLEQALQTQPIPSERVHTQARLLAWVDGVGLFQGLPRRDLRAMSARLERQEVPAWEILVQGERPVNAFYLIETGKVLVVKDWGQETEEIQRELGPGEYFGEYSPLLGGQASTTVVTTEPGVFWALPADEFSRFLKRSLGE